MSSSAAEAGHTTSSAAEVFTSCHKLANTSLGVYPASQTLKSDADSVHLCELLIKKGKWTTSMGHARDKGREYLYVEEMLYLLSDGSLEVIYDSMPLSLAEGYAVLSQRHTPHALVDGPSAYMAFSLLRDQGFVLMRPERYHQVYSRVHAKPTYTKDQILLNNEYAKQQPSKAETGSASSQDNPRKRKAEISLDESATAEPEPPTTEQTDTPTSSAPSSTPTTLFYGAQPPRPAERKRLPRGFKPQARSDETIAAMHEEASRLKQMQVKLGPVSGIRDLFTFDSEPNQQRDPSSAVSEAIEQALPADSTSLPTAVVALSSSSQLPVSSYSSLSDELIRLLSTPCDFFYVWLPPSHAASIAAEMGCIVKTFKRSEPSLPDFICLCTNPMLTYEKLWMVLPHCSREAINTFQQKKSGAAAPSSTSLNSTSSSAISSCVGDVMSRLYELSDERLVAFQDHPATHSLNFSPLIHLRLAVMPIEHASRVFFVDATVMTPKEYLNAAEMPQGLNSMLEIMADSRRN